MSKLNKDIDRNNPSHSLVMDINSKNEELYGEYHDDCKLFKEFCRCKEYTPGESYRVDTKMIRDINDIKLILEEMDLHITPKSKDSYNKIEHLLREIR
jgi:hypothetical protein